MHVLRAARPGAARRGPPFLRELFFEMRSGEKNYARRTNEVRVGAFSSFSSVRRRTAHRGLRGKVQRREGSCVPVCACTCSSMRAVRFYKRRAHRREFGMFTAHAEQILIKCNIPQMSSPHTRRSVCPNRALDASLITRRFLSRITLSSSLNNSRHHKCPITEF